MIVAVTALATVAGVGALAARALDADPVEAGLPAFVRSDFGGVSRATLETSALPYKLVAAGLVLRDERDRNVRLTRADLPAIFRRYGWLFPTTIAHWPASVAAPRFTDRPMGLVGRNLHGPTPLIAIDGVTLGCAGCHAGPLYGADGRATDTVWTGVPNASLDLDDYTSAVYEGLKLAVADPTRARRRAHELFPEMGIAERFALRYVVLPRAKKRVAELVKDGDAPLPFHSGGAGLTNGVAALKHNLGFALGGASHVDETAFVSIPELSNRALRSSLLADGIYTPIGDSAFAPRAASPFDSAHVERLAEIVSFFVVPTMGVPADAAEQGIPRVKPVVRWLTTRYKSPRFPGAIDSARMREGERVFNARCAECHGTYGEGAPRALVSFPNRLVPQSDMNTDSSRWSLVDANVSDQLSRTAFARHMTARRGTGYVAPILSGLWATAPYFHNGSVPTIWHVLSPDERPTRFLVGGHALDYESLGVALERGDDGTWSYPRTYTPWSMPTTYDTREAGKSNRGHEREVAGLSAPEKRALIEYLKTL